MTSADLASVCADESKLRCLRPEFLPRGGCRGSNALDAPTNGPPWCTPWRAPVYIAELPCGMVELSFRGGDMAYAVHAESGAVLSHKRMLTDWGAPVGDPAPHTVRDFSFLATAGYAEYAGAAGHFLNELLPRLVHLDAFLPAHIPILWPPGPIPDRWLTLLREAGVVSSSREMVRDRSERTIFRARRLYVYGTLEPVLAAPVVTWFSQALLADSVSDKLVRPRLATSASLPIAPGARQKLVVLGRAGTGSRQLANGAELVASIAARFPSVDVVEVAPTLDNVEETVAAVAAATVVLSPHGAGLNNILFARRGATAVIEVGFLQEDFHLPSDYACLSRNLGLHYWLVLPISGSYGGPLTVDVERTLGVIVDALKVVSGVTS